jgi:uncharacterized tellurite resistance protein B-like protein
MFGSLKTLIVNLGEDARLRSQFENQRCRLATAALLIRIATVDGEMSKAKLGKLHEVLKSGFELDDLTAALLIDDAAAADRSAIDLYHFTRQLNAVLDEEGRREIVRMMWQIVLVEGHANEFENNIVWRVADLLAVPSRQRIELRKRIAAEGAARAGCPPTNR